MKIASRRGAGVSPANCGVGVPPAWAVVFACALLALGCGPENKPQAGPAPPVVKEPMPSGDTKPADAKPGEESSTPTATWGDAKVKFKDDAGATKFSIKTKSDGAKLVDGSEPEKEIARYTVSGDKLKIKDPADKVLGYVVFTAGHYKIEDAEQKVELFKLQKQADGDWKLEDGADKLIYKIKKRDYGWEIEDGAETSLYKVKEKEGKISLRDPAEKTVVSTKDTIKTLAVACLGFDAIDKVELRAALATLVDLHEGK